MWISRKKYKILLTVLKNYESLYAKKVQIWDKDAKEALSNGNYQLYWDYMRLREEESTKQYLVKNIYKDVTKL